MQEITFDQGVSDTFNSLLADRLAVLIGAGLSMAPPSSLPSAAAIARVAKTKYDAIHGATRAPLPPHVEQQAEFFFLRGELETVYFRQLIDQDAFAGPPNAGHFAIADLMLVRAIQVGLTTNVDFMVETAGQLLFGDIGAGLDGLAVAALGPDVSPLLKIHGCRQRDFANMVWAPSQLGAAPVAGRIASSTTWLNAHLLDRDLLIVGYWTDWDYLNAVLATTLGAVRPSRVIVVDPADGAAFQAKAPELFALGQRAKAGFAHVRASGADFLDAVRHRFSESFVRRILHAGIADYIDQVGNPPNALWTEPPNLDNSTLWQTRRDLEGRIPNEPAKDRNPPAEALLGLTLLQLRARGALPDGPYWLLNGQRVRVLRAVNKPLYRVESEFGREVPPTTAPDLVIAVGAEAVTLPSNIARGTTQGTIARGNKSLWFTRPDAIQHLGL